MTSPFSPTQFVAGRLCLDFLNTANWSETGEIIEEKLNSDADIHSWCDQAGIARPRKGTAGDIQQFRNATRAVFLAALKGQQPAKADLAPLNEALAAIPGGALRPTPDGRFGLSSALALKPAVAVSAMSVLSQPSELSRVKICPGDSCAWLFLDESKNRRRTWCSMETCGNRAKAKRHYRRTRKAAP